MEMTIGTNIKRLRTAKSITQEQLSVAMNVTCAAVSKWERGETHNEGNTTTTTRLRTYAVTIYRILPQRGHTADKQMCMGGWALKDIADAASMHIDRIIMKYAASVPGRYDSFMGTHVDN